MLQHMCPAFLLTSRNSVTLVCTPLDHGRFLLLPSNEKPSALNIVSCGKILSIKRPMNISLMNDVSVGARHDKYSFRKPWHEHGAFECDRIFSVSEWPKMLTVMPSSRRAGHSSVKSGRSLMEIELLAGFSTGVVSRNVCNVFQFGLRWRISLPI